MAAHHPGPQGCLVRALGYLVWRADLCPAPTCVLPHLRPHLESISPVGSKPREALSPCLLHPGVSLSWTSPYPQTAWRTLLEAWLVGMRLVTRATEAGL